MIIDNAWKKLEYKSGTVQNVSVYPIYITEDINEKGLKLVQYQTYEFNDLELYVKCNHETEIIVKPFNNLSVVSSGGGSSSVDTYDKTEIDGFLSDKANTSDVYDKTEIDNTIKTVNDDIDKKANASDVYDKTDIDNTVKTINDDIDKKANASDVYSKTDIDTSLKTINDDIDKKANTDDVYTKTDIDTSLKTINDDIDKKANADDVYSKTDLAELKKLEGLLVIDGNDIILC